jgi:hypothetical protein
VPADVPDEAKIVPNGYVGEAPLSGSRYLTPCLAEANPYQALRTCSITRAANGSDPTCDLKWTLRLYLLPQEPSPARGGSS